jgi:hypothetical protein
MLAELDQPGGKPLAGPRKCLHGAARVVVLLSNAVDGNLVAKVAELQCKIESLVSTSNILLFRGGLFQRPAMKPVFGMSNLACV